jgi:glycerol-3-phosphate dehydrogenase
LPGLGGRNRKCAEAFVKTGKPFEELEKDMLNGQSASRPERVHILLPLLTSSAPRPRSLSAELQGIYTAQEIHTFLQEKGNVDDYPLFKAVRPRRSLAPQQPRRVLIALLACSCQVYEISFEGRKVETLTDGL